MEEGQGTICHQGGSFHLWNGTHWPEQDEATIRAELYDFLDDAKQQLDDGTIAPFNPTKFKVSNVLDALAAYVNTPASVRAPRWLDDDGKWPADEIIACKNGLLHLPTLTLLEHTPNFYTHNALDFDYDANAPEPVEWLKFLGTLWDGKTDENANDEAKATAKKNANQTIETLQEMFGYAFPWGQPNTELERSTGPRQWQRELLEDIRRKLKEGHDLGQLLPLLFARASGHGIGKSTVVSWIILWALSTMSDTRVVVTANTETQLRTKTWPELSKWSRLVINRHWFRTQATSIAAVDPAHERLWRADAIPWSEVNTEAFAGLHNQGRRIVLIFDEASAISDKIWEVSEGALTDADTEILWLAFGNPTRNTGRFRECFGRLHHRWNCGHIDSREVEGTNKEQIAKWVEDYGEDSDFVRVRVRGIFPRAGTMQFISSELVEQAMAKDREPPFSIMDPLIMGVDVARFGDDRSVIRFRRGRDARTIPPIKQRGVDTMTLAARIPAIRRGNYERYFSSTSCKRTCYQSVQFQDAMVARKY